MANLALTTIQQILDANGDPVAGAKVTFYESGTTTLKTAYSDSALTAPLSSPLVADANGWLPEAFFGAGAVKAVVTTAADAALYTVDPCITASDSATGADNISFSPTAEVPATNVQDAIELAAASAASGFTPYGLGVTGNSGLLAALDATNTASGAYRYDAASTGTFPTGFAASDTGIVEMWRETASSAMMMLYPDTSDKVFERRMNASAWGAWREVVTISHTNTVYLHGGAPTVLTSGTAATYNTPTNARMLVVELVGGGGGSGGCDGQGANTCANSAGGGAAGYVLKVITAPQATYTYTVGAAGAAGASGANNGGNGGDTTFAGGAVSLTAGGGVGGAGRTGIGGSNMFSGGAGGTATGGDVNTPGQNGGNSGVLGGDPTSIGNGGSGPWGAGGAASSNTGTPTAGSAGTGYGAGGGGGLALDDNANIAGAAGSAGCIRVWVFY